MTTEIKHQNGVDCAVIFSEAPLITDGQSALDLMMTVFYETGCNRLAICKQAFADHFFVLSSGLAGEVLQKIVNYRVKLAIIGDFSMYTSKPLQDFIGECNRGREVFFVETEQQAIDRLTTAQ